MSDLTRMAADDLQRRPRPTLEDIRRWPATCDVTDWADAVGVSRTHAYDLAKSGNFPSKLIRVGGRRYKVVTASLIALLSGQETGAA